MIPTPFFSSVTDWYHKIRGASQLARCSLMFYTGRRKKKGIKKELYLFFVNVLVGFMTQMQIKTSSFSRQEKARLEIVINAIIPCREFIPALPFPIACVMMQKRTDW